MMLVAEQSCKHRQGSVCWCLVISSLQAFGKEVTVSHPMLSLTEHLLPEFAADVWVCGLSALTAEEMTGKLEAREIIDGTGRTGIGLKRILKQMQPFDLALIMAGTNDLGRSMCNDLADIDVSVDRMLDDLCYLHEVCHYQGVRTVAMSVPPNKGALKSKQYRLRWEMLNTKLQNWAESVEGVALFVDTGALVPFADNDLGGRGKLWESDGLHFTSAGSLQLGRGLAPLVAPLLRNLPERSDASSLAEPFAKVKEE